MDVSVWEAIFMLVVLKVPMVYLAVVLWWALRATPESSGGADSDGWIRPLTPCGWDDWKRRRSVATATTPGTAVRADARSGADASRMSAMESPQHADRVSGFLCACSFALSGIALARHPALLATTAIVVALVAVRMTKSHRTLAAAAVLIATLAFFFGMVIAVLTDSDLY